MTGDDVGTALRNLQAIKNDEDPRSTAEDSSSAQPSNTRRAGATDDVIVQAVEEELRRTLDEHSFLRDHIGMDDLQVFIAGWKSRRGYCWYNKRPTARSFEGQISRNDFPFESGIHAIGIARGIYRDEKGWRGTVRHELAHAYLYEKHGSNQKHNAKFKRLNQRIGGTSGGKAPCTDFDYGVACPNGCFETGYHKRSKVVQRPFSRLCSTCEEKPVSFDWGDRPPEEPGTCAVESIDWDTYEEYLGHPTRNL